MCVNSLYRYKPLIVGRGVTTLPSRTKCNCALIVEQLPLERLFIMNIRQALIASAVVSALVAPAAAFAQQHSTVTRAQVKAELAQLRATGYQGDTETSYPVMI